MELITLFSLLLFLLILLAARVLYVLYIIHTESNLVVKTATSFRTLLCAGSGGHTNELMRLVRNLDHNKYNPRMYTLADNDISSQHKILDTDPDSSMCKIPRSRNVGQSYTSSVITTIDAFVKSIPIVYSFKPDIVICNGPGTCVPICLIAFFMRCLFIKKCRIIYVESICRVRSLSLTGYILQMFADIFVVQWPELRDVCVKSKYFGRLT